jgi:hypothetical protein
MTKPKGTQSSSGRRPIVERYPGNLVLSRSTRDIPYNNALYSIKEVDVEYECVRIRVHVNYIG